ncbi:MAG: glutamate synthase [archaeon]|nr:glutamate synthase [archaeon]
MPKMDCVEKIIRSREKLGHRQIPTYKSEAEGGCGVVGLACSIPVAGHHILQSCLQMHNRGNGKGGGIAAVGLLPEQMGVPRAILEEDYLLQVAYLDSSSRKLVEDSFISPYLQVDHAEKIPSLDEYRKVPGLEVRPPDVIRYFVRVDEDVLDRFSKENNLEELERHQVEDEFIYQNSFKLNQKFYASLGKKRAFVLSHGKNMMVLKIVGYAEQLIKYYCLEDVEANIWIGHQRYPTKGRVWHPGGAHPFVGLHEALVHNGDFANYVRVTKYLRQRNIHPQFLTDTEVSVLLFDLLSRVYRYPLEYIIEALAPTTERDFYMLPEEKRRIYKAIQLSHMTGSPDGPWFFIIAENDPYKRQQQLIGITDTSMLRPQVFALQEGDVKIGVIASEKQAIDAVLKSLSDEDGRFLPIADKYWNARGGSHTDGGAFIFTLTDIKGDETEKELRCTDKFGKVVTTIKNPRQAYSKSSLTFEYPVDMVEKKLSANSFKTPLEMFNRLIDFLYIYDHNDLFDLVGMLRRYSTRGDQEKSFAIEVLTLLMDRRYNIGDKRRSLMLTKIQQELDEIFSSTPRIGSNSNYQLIDWQSRNLLQSPQDPDRTLIINMEDFYPEGPDSASRFIVSAYNLGWKKVIAYSLRGQRFLGCGLGHKSDIRIDVYGSSGDYLGSGLDGAEIYVHGNSQDQVGQIFRKGKLVVYGDVGQTFMYGAKGGEVYVLGNAAGRPLINAVGKPRVVINGTCLDYLAESFMAGDPLRGGGFVILNGIRYNDRGEIVEQETPYPGGNLFSLASGGAIYLRDPHKLVTEDQLNSGKIVQLSLEDCELILPYLRENERLYGISVDRLLTIDGKKRRIDEVYRKVVPIPLKALSTVGQ